MKISKFRDADTYEDKLHKETLELELSDIKAQDAALHQDLLEKQEVQHQDLTTQQEENHNELITKEETLHADLTQKQQTQHESLIAAQEAHYQEINSDLESLKGTLSGVQPRSERTKIYNQKIEEDFIILETTDALMRLPQECQDIFDPTTALREVNQYFVLEEGIDENHCSQRAFNFDTDSKYALRLDQYSGDSEGYFDLYGHLDNDSSDIFLVNDTLYKIKLRLDDDPQFVNLEDGFTLSFNDIEDENILSFKRDHTISGYTFNYIVESKANSQ